MAFLKKKGVELLTPMHPPYCPDLSGIKKVWHLLHLAMGKRNPKNLAELMNVCREEWLALDQDKIDRMCRHFRTQVREA